MRIAASEVGRRRLRCARDEQGASCLGSVVGSCVLSHLVCVLYFSYVQYLFTHGLAHTIASANIHGAASPRPRALTKHDVESSLPLAVSACLFSLYLSFGSLPHSNPPSCRQMSVQPPRPSPLPSASRSAPQPFCPMGHGSAVPPCGYGMGMPACSRMSSSDALSRRGAERSTSCDATRGRRR